MEAVGMGLLIAALVIAGAVTGLVGAIGLFIGLGVVAKKHAEKKEKTDG